MRSEERGIAELRNWTEKYPNSGYDCKNQTPVQMGLVRCFPYYLPLLLPLLLPEHVFCSFHSPLHAIFSVDTNCSHNPESRHIFAFVSLVRYRSMAQLLGICRASILCIFNLFSECLFTIFNQPSFDLLKVDYIFLSKQ